MLQAEQCYVEEQELYQGRDVTFQSIYQVERTRAYTLFERKIQNQTRLCRQQGERAYKLHAGVNTPRCPSISDCLYLQSQLAYALYSTPLHHPILPATIRRKGRQRSVQPHEHPPVQSHRESFRYSKAHQGVISDRRGVLFLTEHQTPAGRQRLACHPSSLTEVGSLRIRSDKSTRWQRADTLRLTVKTGVPSRYKTVSPLALSHVNAT